MSLEVDLKAAIEKNLAAEVAERLKQRLSKAEADEVHLRVMTERTKQLELERDDLRKRVERDTQLRNQEEDLQKRTRALDDQTIAFEVERKHYDRRLADHKDFIDRLLGNRVLRERMQHEIPLSSGDVSEANYGPQGGNLVRSTGQHPHKTETFVEREDA